MPPKATLAAPIRRNRPAEAGWAVSYADFLMVLLSFFILFFSTDRSSILNHVLVDLHGASRGPSSASGTGTSADGLALTSTEILEDLARKLPGVDLRLAKDRKRIELRLSDGLYRFGEFRAPETSLAPVLGALAPYQDRLLLTVVGHADATRYQRDTPVIEKNNRTLAGVRAAYAASYIETRLPGLRIQTRTTNRDARRARSLTILIEEIANQGENHE
jgi:flagellar motor protein MotB